MQQANVVIEVDIKKSASPPKVAKRLAQHQDHAAPSLIEIEQKLGRAEELRKAEVAKRSRRANIDAERRAVAQNTLDMRKAKLEAELTDKQRTAEQLRA